MDIVGSVGDAVGSLAEDAFVGVVGYRRGKSA